MCKTVQHISHTNKSLNKGLISTDRSNQATLLFTIPRSSLSRLQRIYLLKYLELSCTGAPPAGVLRCWPRIPGWYDSGAVSCNGPTVVCSHLRRAFKGKYRCVLARILTQRRSVIIRRMVASRQWLFSQAQIPIIRINGSSRTELNYYCDDLRYNKRLLPFPSSSVG